MITVTFGIGTRVRRSRTRREGVIMKFWPPDFSVALVRWYDTKDDELVPISQLLKVG
jgi:hypothetical protein